MRIVFAFLLLFSLSIKAQEYPAAAADPAVRSRFTEFGAEPVTSTPEEFGHFVSTEVVKWREIITKGGITLE